MADLLTSKRLHISGLTPAISADDLIDRFSSFGIVKALDGLDALDGNGQPRKFAYLTLEASQAKLTRCVNSLSGTTWKGAKLRIGDAKPDWNKRFELEKKFKRQIENDESPRPAKRRRLPRDVQGVEAANMTIVTPQDVENRKGWKKTALSHLIHPIRMRPLHPLPPVGSQLLPVAKKKNRTPLNRARRQTIDPTLYGAVHLTGVMLDGDVVHVVREKAAVSPAVFQANAQSAAVPAKSDPVSDALKKDKEKNLRILEQLFADEDWDGHAEVVEGESDLEDEMDNDDGSVEDIEMEPSQEGPVAAEAITRLEPPVTAEQKLKDLFGHHKETEDFSLLKTLALDPEELDDEMFASDAPHPVQHTMRTVPDISVVATPKNHTLRLSSKVPLFFPTSANASAKDLFSIAKARGWGEGFWRTETSDEIRKRWEDKKVELTRDWKKRHREALKRKKRGGGDLLE